jgi:hypothetical protein
VRPTRFDRGYGKALKWIRAYVSYEGDDCVTWPYARVGGYGHLGFEGAMYYAHRVMCEYIHGPAPSRKHHAAHSCGKGHEGCVNPKHISWKTVSENQLDRRIHGTTGCNSFGMVSRFSPSQIAEIRALKGIKTQAEIAEMFGVKRGCIQYWHKHDRPPFAPGTSMSTLYRRRRLIASR